MDLTVGGAGGTVERFRCFAPCGGLGPPTWCIPDSQCGWGPVVQRSSAGSASCSWGLSRPRPPRLWRGALPSELHEPWFRGETRAACSWRTVELKSFPMAAQPPAWGSLRVLAPVGGQPLNALAVRLSPRSAPPRCPGRSSVSTAGIEPATSQLLLGLTRCELRGTIRRGDPVPVQASRRPVVRRPCCSIPLRALPACGRCSPRKNYVTRSRVTRQGRVWVVAQTGPGQHTVTARRRCAAGDSRPRTRRTTRRTGSTVAPRAPRCRGRTAGPVRRHRGRWPGRRGRARARRSPR